MPNNSSSDLAMHEGSTWGRGRREGGRGEKAEDQEREQVLFIAFLSLLMEEGWLKRRRRWRRRRWCWWRKVYSEEGFIGRSAHGPTGSDPLDLAPLSVDL